MITRREFLKSVIAFLSGLLLHIKPYSGGGFEELKEQTTIRHYEEYPQPYFLPVSNSKPSAITISGFKTK